MAAANLPQSRQEIILFGGGLDQESSPLRMAPGMLLACLNFEGSMVAGYSRIQGYERYDGRPAPHLGFNIDPYEDTTEARRDAIEKVPGVGPVRGVHVFAGHVFAFRDHNETDAKMWMDSEAGWVEVDTGEVTLNATGKYQFLNYSFESAAGAEVMVGVSGVNKAFVFDGSTYTEIDVEGETGFPRFVGVMNNYLFLGYESGALYWSAVGDPTDFTSLSGAGVLGVGMPIVGLHAGAGGVLIIRMRGKISVLYGNSPEEWENRDLRTNSDTIGGEPYSEANYGSWYYLDEYGVMELGATDRFGDFASNMISRSVTRFLTPKIKSVVGAMTVKSKRQIRWFFSQPLSERTDILTLKFGDGLEGFTTQSYPVGTYCATAGSIGGEEILLIGTNDGYVMRLDQGNSFDGEEIESYLRLPFWHMKSPQMRKHIKRVFFNAESSGVAEIRVRPFFNYAGPEPANHGPRTMTISGNSTLWDMPLWDEAAWNDFYWASAPVQDGRADVTGTGKNMSLSIYHKGITAPFTLYEAIVQYTLRGVVR